MSRQPISSVLARWRAAGFVILAVFVGLGGSLVFAHGGDSGRIHGCVDPATGADGRPNVIIVAPNAGCPAGYNAQDWSIEGPPGPQGATGQAGAQGPPAAVATDSGGLDNPEFAELKETGGAIARKLVPKGTKTFTKTVGPNKNALKTAQRLCPATHPDLVSGGPDFTNVEPAQIVFAQNQAGLFGWGQPFREGWQTIAIHQPHAGHEGGANNHSWALKVTVVCKEK
jgi:hypothetical protein